MSDDGAVPWRELLPETVAALAAAGIDPPDQEARWLVGEAAGLDGAELVLGLDEPATVGGVRRLDAMVARRAEGEPLQYVLGHWGFRTLDLLVDQRVLIPRPETEQGVTGALDELDRLAAEPDHDVPVRVADLGTGSGAIALAIAVERPRALVWATDAHEAAVAVARANLAGVGRAGARVTLAVGDWFEALPPELAGSLDLVVSNPPYVPADARLPRAVADWEPASALVPGPTGLEALEHLVDRAGAWLRPGGALMVELSPEQVGPVGAMADDAGLVVARTVPDLAGRPRAVVARRPLS